MATSLDKLTYMEETREGGYLPRGGALQKYLSQINTRATEKCLNQECSIMEPSTPECSHMEEEEKAMGPPPTWMTPGSIEWLYFLVKLPKKVQNYWANSFFRLRHFPEACKGEWKILDWLPSLKKLPEQNSLKSCQYKLKVYETILSVPDEY